MEVEECNEDNCNENQGMNAPKWKKKTIQWNLPVYFRNHLVRATTSRNWMSLHRSKYLMHFLRRRLSNISYSRQTYTHNSQEKIASRQLTMNWSVFLGINILMGIKKLPSYRFYWSTDPKLGDSFKSNLMLRHRFDWFLSNLHLNDNLLMPARNSHLYYC